MNHTLEAAILIAIPSFVAYLVGVTVGCTRAAAAMIKLGWTPPRKDGKRHVEVELTPEQAARFIATLNGKEDEDSV